MTRKEAKKRIEVMQAYVDGKTIEYYSNSDGKWIEIQDPAFFSDIEYRFKPDAVEHPTEPKSWEEFCETHPIHSGEAHVSLLSNVMIMDNRDTRDVSADKHLYPSEDYAKAALAQAQLLQLRQAYVGDWKPDWTDIRVAKYCILIYSSKLRVGESLRLYRWLSFPNEKLAEKFLSNFRDLIETVKPLL